MFRFAAVIFLLLLTGCGYHLEKSPSGVFSSGQSIAIALFANRTHEPLLENAVTRAFYDEGERRHVPLLTSGSSELSIEGVLLQWTDLPVSYNSNDQATEFRISLTAEVLVRSVEDGLVLWKGTLTRRQVYTADSTLHRRYGLRRAAVVKLAQTMAGDFWQMMSLPF